MCLFDNYLGQLKAQRWLHSAAFERVLEKGKEFLEVLGWGNFVSSNPVLQSGNLVILQLKCFLKPVRVKQRDAFTKIVCGEARVHQVNVLQAERLAELSFDLANESVHFRSCAVACLRGVAAAAQHADCRVSHLMLFQVLRLN